MANVLPLIIGGGLLFYVINSSKVSKSSSKYSNTKINKIPPNLNCIDLGNNLLAFPRMQLPDGDSEIDNGQKLPMIIVLHGRGGNETSLQNAIPKDIIARVFFIRANTKNNLFFIPRLKDKEEIVAPVIEEAGEDLLEGIDMLLGIYPTSKLILFGFSQGSALVTQAGKTNFNIPTYVMAFSGSLPSLLYPTQVNSNKYYFYNGSLDTTVPFQLGVNTFNAFKQKGFDAIFRETKNSHIYPPKKYVQEFFKLAGF